MNTDQDAADAASTQDFVATMAANDTVDTAAILQEQMTAKNILPEDADKAALVGRVWRPGLGASVVRIDAKPDGSARVTDITMTYRTVSKLTEEKDPAAALRAAQGEDIGTLQELLDNADHDKNKAYLLAPNDLQTIKAAGVTFVKSLVYRMVEEGLRGVNDPAQAKALEEKIWDAIKSVTGETDLECVQPGSEMAMRLFHTLTNKPLKEGEPLPDPATTPLDKIPGLGFSPHYPRVGLDVLAEIFSKAPTMTAVGTGSKAGYNEAFDSFGKSISWTNPEPEIVSVFNSKGLMVGAALGNDVNDRLLEGKSALYLGIAKDQECTCGVGPFIRLFDENFKQSDIDKTQVRLQVKGTDGFTYDESNKMSEISRTPQSMGDQLFKNHGFADGALLFNGTMVIPGKRGKTPEGTDIPFTHKDKDFVFISEARLGGLGMVMHPALELKQAHNHDEPSLNSFLEGHITRALDHYKAQQQATEGALRRIGPTASGDARGRGYDPDANRLRDVLGSGEVTT